MDTEKEKAYEKLIAAQNNLKLVETENKITQQRFSPLWILLSVKQMFLINLSSIPHIELPIAIKQIQKKTQVSI